MAYDDPDVMTNPAETMRQVMEEFGHHKDIDLHETLDLTRADLVTVPKHRDIKDLTPQIRSAAEYLKPARRKGTARLEDLNSIISWANRFKGETSALFAEPDMAAPKLTCIADYHAAGPADQTTVTGDPTARHCHHKATYSFPLSDEWKAWMGVSGVPLEKDDMGEFIEINAKDVMDPTPAILKGEELNDNQGWENRLIRTANQIDGKFGQLHSLLQMSKQFQVFETSDLSVSTNRDTGEAEISFVSEHKDAAGKPLNIPNLIIIAIPVFRGGAAYRMAVRFRYRKKGGKICFILSLYNPEKSFEAAFKEAVEQAEQDTQLPLFYGAPETS
ncbi:YfdQ family protein [Phaeobacter inhibens]|uniref:YfdQ family protein n=1 Tax=Phaeobacter inhibens TaxID=221822 RepID=UPI0021A7ABDA|nr:YfdQ family protein [Phaeobacter inhibens]UWR73142.1 YfdQ family protein [Phaeobacter inhibens]